MDNFEVKKVENCFKNSQTYEYKIGVNLDKEFIDTKRANLSYLRAVNRLSIFDRYNKN